MFCHPSTKWMVPPIAQTFVCLSARQQAGDQFPAAETMGRFSVKLVLAIINDYDVDRVLRSLTSAGLSVTRIASAGGFLRTGNVTIMVGVEDAELDQCLDLLAHAGARRVVASPQDPTLDYEDIGGHGIAAVSLGGMSVFVLKVERYERMMAPATPVHPRR